MPCIEWNDSFSLGNNEIDEEHLCLVKMVNKIYDCCLTDDQDGTLDVLLGGLLNHLQAHFSTELELMTKYDYSGLSDHIKDHEVYINQVAKFQQDFVEGKCLMAGEMAKFLDDLLIDHILVSDRDFYTLLATKGVS